MARSGVIRVGYRVKMQREYRAKQFMPFAALRGYPEALRRQEEIATPQAELPEERQEELDFKLRQIKENDLITVIYFNGFRYLKQTGMLTKKDVAGRVLQVGNSRIGFDDIYDISSGADRFFLHGNA